MAVSNWSQICVASKVERERKGMVVDEEMWEYGDEVGSSRKRVKWSDICADSEGDSELFKVSFHSLKIY